MQQDVTESLEDNETGLTADALVERAASAIRDLSGAHEANEEVADRLLQAYETVTAANRDLADEVLAREQAHAADIERIARMQSEIQRLTSLSREALQAVQSSRDENDRLKEDLRVGREDYGKLNATHENLIETNAKLTSTVERLLTEISSGTRGIRDGSRRLSDMVHPTPARPRSTRAPEAPEREAPAQPAQRVARPAAATPNQRQSEESFLEAGDRDSVNTILDQFTNLVPLHGRTARSA